MPSWMVLGIGLFTCFGVFVFGLFALISPSKLREMQDRVGGWDRFSTPNPEWKPGLDLEWRAVGLIMAGGALWVLATIIRAVFFHLHPPVRPVIVPPIPRHGPDWYSLGLGFVMVLFGTYISLRPEKLLRWAQSTMPHRKFGGEINQKSLWGIRIFGGLWILVALQAVVAGLKH